MAIVRIEMLESIEVDHGERQRTPARDRVAEIGEQPTSVPRAGGSDR
jgi:hypothetical protein